MLILAVGKLLRPSMPNSSRIDMFYHQNKKIFFEKKSSFSYHKPDVRNFWTASTPAIKTPKKWIFITWCSIYPR